MALPVKDAVQRARMYLEELFPVRGRIELEEVEPHPSKLGAWKITFSYDREEEDPYGISRMLPPEARPKTRVYKVVTVDASGQPESVKMQ